MTPPIICWVGLALSLAVHTGCPSHSVRPNPTSVEVPAGTRLFDATTGLALTSGDALKRLQRRHVYVGERHGEAAYHSVQLAVLKVLAARGPVAVGVEWLGRDQQPLIDAFVRDKSMDWAAFDKAADVTKRWRAKAAVHHRRILGWCRDNGVPVVGLNAPEGLARAVAKGGPEAVPPELRRWLPPLDTGNDPHRDFFTEMMSAHAHGGKMVPGMLARYYLAQLVWDESMATAASAYLERSSKRTLIVLAGLGHVDHGHGIPLRVRKLSGGLGFAIVRPLPAGEAPVSSGAAAYPGRLADVLWGAPEGG